jgi:hypothetical protein
LLCAFSVSVSFPLFPLSDPFLFCATLIPSRLIPVCILFLLLVSSSRFLASHHLLYYSSFSAHFVFILHSRSWFRLLSSLFLLCIYLFLLPLDFTFAWNTCSIVKSFLDLLYLYLCPSRFMPMLYDFLCTYVNPPLSYFRALKVQPCLVSNS